MANVLLKSAYEVAREERLKRNKQVLLDLGLINAGATVNPAEQQVITDEKEYAEAETSGLQEKKLPKAKREPIEPTRRSKRVQGLNPEGDKLEEIQALEDEEESQEDDRDARMRMKIERLKALHEERKTAYKNPTATYDHTWMRVRTMSDKALERRINVIENALGQHCIVKMRMFAEVLLLAEKDELAKKAEESLERLLALGLN